jgi:hypothetical protein
LNDEQIATINYLIKTRSVKYIASINKDYLFPEKIIGQPRWCEIDKLFYTKFPSFRSKTEIMVGYKDGTQLHANAFGERTMVPGWFVRQQEKKREAEEAAKKAKRILKTACALDRRPFLYQTMIQVLTFVSSSDTLIHDQGLQGSTSGFRKATGSKRSVATAADNIQSGSTTNSGFASDGRRMARPTSK